VQPETPSGETQVVTDPKTNVTPTATPPSQTVDPAIEELRKKAEQAEMRANQLANQLKAKDDAEAAAQAKQLEEQNQYKTLYEQEKAKRTQIEADGAAAEKAATLKTEADKLFAQYPEQVRSLAQEAGMTLSDTDEASIDLFKQRLDKVNGFIKSPKVGPNNPGQPNTGSPDMSPMDYHAMLNDPKKFEEYLKKNTKGIASMMRQAV